MLPQGWYIQNLHDLLIHRDSNTIRSTHLPADTDEQAVSQDDVLDDVNCGL